MDFQPTLFCRHRKPKGDPHDFCVRCAEQANWKNCDGITQICIKCKDLDEEDWAHRRKSDKKREYKREAARRRRSSGSVYSVTISEETMEDSQVLSQSQTLPASHGRTRKHAINRSVWLVRTFYNLREITLRWRSAPPHS